MDTWAQYQLNRFFINGISTKTQLRGNIGSLTATQDFEDLSYLKVGDRGSWSPIEFRNFGGLGFWSRRSMFSV